MSSLRRRLFLRLLLGLGALWLCGLVLVYSIVHKSLLDQIDTELRMIAADVPSLLPEGGALPQDPASERMLEFFMTESGFYFEVWDEEFLFSDRSPSLGAMDLPLPEDFSPEPIFTDVELSNGEAVRVIMIRQASRLLGVQGTLEHNVVAARNRDDLNQQLKLLVAGCLAAGLLGALLSALIVRVSVVGALHPLKQVDAQLAAMDADSLEERFSTQPMPEELQPLVARLNELMERLQASFDRERRFSADLAHELRTPVAELKAMAEVAIKWPEQSEPKQFQEVLDISEEMQGTIETLLALARVEQGHIEAKTRVRPAVIVDKVWRTLESQAKTRGLSWAFELAEQLEVDSHPELLTRILSNLLSNAVAYTPAGGRLGLQGGTRGSSFYLEIRNEAAGLEEDTLEHLFERFWRGDQSRTESKHSGLGLTLAQSCANAMQMELKAEIVGENEIRFILQPSPEA